MTVFFGNAFNNTANATGAGTLIGFAGGGIAQLQDAIGDTFFGMAGDDVVVSGIAADTIFGGLGNDFGNGGDGNDALFGEAGNDILLGGNGNDLADGGAGNDRLVGGNGNDRLIGGDGNDSADGGAGADYILGGAGNDFLFGQDGSDLLNGGGGLDRMAGGLGGDVFDYDALTDSGAAFGVTDVIFDFQTAFFGFVDRIDLRTIDANPFFFGDQAFAFRDNLPFNGVGQVRWFNAGGNTFVDLNTDFDVLPEMRIQLNGIHNLDAVDFLL